ncbi:small nuclear ribonucleoprotein 35 [Pilobolus umbonatus]|nr:small nuclear ribonucleoprotein 35 [Pilobolus umbonatus]
MWYAKEYIPVQAGSIDGTDKIAHDSAIERARLSDYSPPHHLKTDPSSTLFVSRLNYDTTEESLRTFFEKYGDIDSVRLIRNNVTGISEGYGFVTYKSLRSTEDAYKRCNGVILDDHAILVDYERSRLMKGWIPRRLGGGFGGKKESGQLRFGARDRPFRNPHRDQSSIPSGYRVSDVWKTYAMNGYKDTSKHRSTSSSHGDRERDRRSHRSHRYESSYKRRRRDDYDGHSSRT